MNTFSFPPNLCSYVWSGMSEKHRGESMPHKRSVLGQQKRDVKQFIRALNFHDTEVAEIVFTVTQEALFTLLIRKYGFVHPKAADLFHQKIKPHVLGDVLVDKRGRGTLQQVPKPLNGLRPYTLQGR